MTKESSLGKSIRASRFKKNQKHSNLHIFDDRIFSKTSKSVTHQSDLENLMNIAQLAGEDFQAEKHSPFVVSSKISRKDTAPLENIKETLKIPRRPAWKNSDTPDELHHRENLSFLEWRRGLAEIENSGLYKLTPFERNIEVWKQLWRVVEFSDIIIQIVDARNPLMFYCEDLATYCSEFSPPKKSIILANKADLLSVSQIKEWDKYFLSKGIEVYFFSAKLINEAEAETKKVTNSIYSLHNDIFLNVLLDKWSNKGYKIGLVGYPNVGKSSTINSIVGTKKVSVASTPGKTKHFQTIILASGIHIYDCPGLVFPSVTISQADQILNGILSIDNMREWNTSIDLLLEKIPIHIISRMYGLSFAKNVKINASLLLSQYSISRGFFTASHGNPDESRAARIILKDFVKGRLLFCCPPPDFKSVNEFNGFPENSFFCDTNNIEPIIDDAFLKTNSVKCFESKTKLQNSKKHYKGRKPKSK